MDKNRFRKLLRRNRRPRRVDRRADWSTRLAIESLEERRMLATIDWSGANDGTTWSDSGNWVGGNVPGSGDDAVIDIAGNNTITYDGFGDVGSITVSANNTLSITGGSLSIDGPNNSTISGGLAMSGGQLLIGNGLNTFSFNATGTTTLADTSLEVGAGATLSLPELTTISVSNLNTEVFEAEGAGAVLSLTGLTSITNPGGSGGNALPDIQSDGGVVSNILHVGNGGNGSTLGIATLAAGDIEMPNLTEVKSGQTVMQSAGPGSVMDLGSLTDVVGTGNTLTLNQGGSVTLSSGSCTVVPSSGSGLTETVPGTPTGLELVLPMGTQNDFTLDAQQNASVTLQDGTFTGTTTFNVSEGATATLGGDPTYSGTLVGTGQGNVQIAPDRLFIGDGGLTFNIPGNILQWTAGIIDGGAGELTNLGTLNVTGTNFEGFYSDGTLDNFGTINDSGTGTLYLGTDNIFPVILQNEPGATFVISSGATLGETEDEEGNTAVPEVINDGTMQLTSGTTDFNIPDGLFSNSGTLAVSSGQLVLDMGTITDISGNTLADGTWQALDGGSLQLPGGTSVTSSNANIALDGPGASISGIDLGTNAGTLTLTDGATLATSSGFTNSGLLTMGGPKAGSLLNVNGTFTQTSAGALNFQIGGTPNSSDFGQVVASGAAALAGGVSATLVNGFTPSSGQSFSVMSFASETGLFSTVANLNAQFTQQLTSTNLSFSDNPAISNLLPTSVNAPTSITPGASITFSWQAENEGANTATGPWQDSVYLSTTPTITASSILLGSVQESGNVGVGGTYNSSLTTTVPAITLGNYYVLVDVDSLYNVPDSNRSNNILAANNTTTAGVPTLAVGTPTNGSFTAPGQEQYYQVTVPSGGSLVVSLASSATSGQTAIYASYGALPTQAQFDEKGDLAGEASQALVVPDAQAGTYYILAYDLSGAATTAGYSLNVAQTANLSIASLGLGQAGNGGDVTVPITGTGLTAGTTAKLELHSSIVSSVGFGVAGVEGPYAIFDLAGEPTGDYALSVQNGNSTATASQTLQVVSSIDNFAGVPGGAPGTTTGSQLEILLSAPGNIRYLVPTTAYVTVTNVGNTDAMAPLLNITMDPTLAELKLASQSSYQDGTLEFIAANPNGLAGIILPGQSVTVPITIEAIGTTQPGDPTPIQLQGVTTDQTIDWSSQEAALQPPNISSSVWSAVFSNFVSSVGTTEASFNSELAGDENYLSQFGEETDDVSQLLSFEIVKADAAFVAPTIATTEDDSLPGQGMNLIFGRTYQESILNRDTSGILGVGWTTTWDISATTESSGNVDIDMSGQSEIFTRVGSGFEPPAGETARLSIDGTGYLMTELSGTVYQFNNNGTLDYVQDTHSNRITAGYNGQNQLVSLVESSPTDADVASFGLTYNGQRHLSSLEDSTGLIFEYGYDPTGTLLTTVTEVNSSSGQTVESATTYSYVSSDNAADNDALASISYANGTHAYFTYDADGRLTTQSLDDGADELTYDYLGYGGYTVTDADNHTSTYLYNEQGQTVEYINALGGVTTYTYDANSNLISTTGPLGNQATFTYNADDEPIKMTDALGYTTTFAYNTAGDVTSETNADDQTTSYAYDSANDLLSVTYADGTKQVQTYDPLGNAIQFVNQRGQVTRSSFNSAGLVTEEQFSDGSNVVFAYNDRGDITSATQTDANNDVTYQTTFSYNDSHNPDLLTSVVNSDGTSLTFTYDADGLRTQSVDQTGFTLDYMYDAQGRLSELVNATGGGDSPIAIYTYDAAGNLIQTDDGNGTRTVYTYDATNAILSITNYAADHTTINSFDDYTRNALGDVLTDTNQDGTWSYIYDADSRLTHAVFTVNNTDPDGLTDQSLQYTYDGEGNRLSETVNGVTTTYSYNDMNEVTSSVTAGVTTIYTYDASGNLLTETTGGDTTAYTYNDRGELTAVSGPGDSTTYAYDAQGNRISQTVNGVTTEFQYDPGPDAVVAQYDGNGNLLAHYTYGQGLTSQVSAGGVASYYNFDSTGNTVGISNATGSYVDSYSYLPFGVVQAFTAALANPFTFSGQLGVIDDGNGTYQMQVREYSAKLGQFLSPDPLNINGGDTNLRRYAGNNPTNGFDPLGLADLDATGANPEMAAANQAVQDQAAADAAAANQRMADNMQRINSSQQAQQEFMANKPAPTTPQQYYMNQIDYRESIGQLSAEEAAAARANITAQYGTAAGEAGAAAEAGQTAAVAESGLARLFGAAAPFIQGVGEWLGALGNWFAALTIASNIPKASQLAYGLGQNFQPQNLSNLPGALLANLIKPFDPNLLSGPAGTGPLNAVLDTQTLGYDVEFENDPPQATAPVLDATVTLQLSSNLDWSTFELGNISFGSTTVNVPQGLQSYSATVQTTNVDGTPLEVVISASLNLSTGLVTWLFTSLDPMTGMPPTDALAGFLPVNENGNGAALVSFDVRPKSGLTTGTTINEQASVVFDTNAPVITNSYSNVIDAGYPTSTVETLPATTTSTTFTVNWQGTDSAAEAGIAGYNVYVSDDDGPYEPFVSDTTKTSADFMGQIGHTYSFYSQATDNLGFIQPTPISAQATTTTVVPGPMIITGATGDNLTLTFTGATTFNLTLNGTTTPYTTTDITKLVYNGPSGFTKVVFDDPSTSDAYTATQSFSATDVVGSNFEFDATSVANLYIYANSPSSTATINVANVTGSSNFFVDAANGGYSYIADPGSGTYSELSGFSGETVTGSAGATYAYVYSTSHATVVGNPTGSTITVGGVSTTLADFPQLIFVGASDGTDSATLHTEGGNFVASPSFSYVSGNFNGGPFMIGALYAANVTAQATNPTDSAFFYSYGGDAFNGNPTQSTLTGSAAGFQTFVVGATGFQAVTVEESGEGTDAANLSSPGGGVFISTPTVSTLAIGSITVLTVMTSSTSNGTSLAVPSQVNVTGAGSDTAYLYDGPGSNSFAASGNKATLSRSANGVAVSQFALVIAEQTAGTDDTVSQQSIDFALRTVGNWTSV